jgi:hypothetical protein
MPKESVFFLALAHDLAHQIVDRLKTSGFSINDVFALSPDQDTTGELAQGPSVYHESGSQRILGTSLEINGATAARRLQGKPETYKNENNHACGTRSGAAPIAWQS